MSLFDRSRDAPFHRRVAGGVHRLDDSEDDIYGENELIFGPSSPSPARTATRRRCFSAPVFVRVCARPEYMRVNEYSLMSDSLSI